LKSTGITVKYASTEAAKAETAATTA